MGKGIKKVAAVPDLAPVSLGELSHASVRRAIETAVHEELQATLGARAYERTEECRGYRHGTSERTLTGPTGPVPFTLPRTTRRTGGGRRSGARGGCPAAHGACPRSTRRCWPRSWPAATSGASARPCGRWSRPRPCPRAPGRRPLDTIVRQTNRHRRYMERSVPPPRTRRRLLRADAQRPKPDFTYAAHRVPSTAPRSVRHRTGPSRYSHRILP